MSEPTAMERLRARQQQLAALRGDLLSGEEARRTDGLRRLYLDLAEKGEIWFDRLGHVARVDGEEGFEAGLVELILCLAFDDWPPEALTPPPGFVPPAPSTSRCCGSASN